MHQFCAMSNHDGKAPAWTLYTSMNKAILARTRVDDIDAYLMAVRDRKDF